jgi:hypothetical protein
MGSGTDCSDTNIGGRERRCNFTAGVRTQRWAGEAVWAAVLAVGAVVDRRGGRLEPGAIHQISQLGTVQRHRGSSLKRAVRSSFVAGCASSVMSVPLLGSEALSLAAGALFNALLCCNGCAESGKGLLQRAVRVTCRCMYRTKNHLVGLTPFRGELRAWDQSSCWGVILSSSFVAFFGSAPRGAILPFSNRGSFFKPFFQQTALCSTRRRRGRTVGTPFAPTASGRRGAQERSRDATACGARVSARPLTAPSTVAALVVTP